LPLFVQPRPGRPARRGRRALENAPRWVSSPHAPNRRVRKIATEVKIEDLEQQLDSMLDIEKFPPPDEFRKHALVTDESLSEEAAQSLEVFWSRQAKELVEWFDEPDEGLDESNAPFY